MSRREAILLVPGIRQAKQGEHLDVLVDGLRAAVEGFECAAPSAAAIEGLLGKRVACKALTTDDAVDVDVFECFVSDLVPTLTSQTALVRLREGTSLLGFWFFSGIWRGLGSRKYLVTTALLSSAVLMLWYFSVVVLGMKALGAIEVKEQGWMRDAVAIAAAIGDHLGSWMVWLGIGTLIGMFRGDRLADIGHCLRGYLRDDELRGAFRARLREPLLALKNTKQYERVTIVAHSFGSLIALDVLADFQVKDGPKLRVVTLGSPAAILRFVGRHVADELRRAAGNKQIAQWVDFSSPSDWMGAPLPLTSPGYPFDQKILDDMGGWMARFTGSTHRAYFHRREVMELLLTA